MAAGSEVKQLILQVDAAVAVAQRNVRSLAQSVEQDSNKMDAALGRVEKSHARMGQQLAKTGQFRGGMQQLSFQIGDITQQMALGVDGSRIFLQQSGQVIQALQIMGGETQGFLRFLGGPWGTALTTAATLLSTTLIPKLFENKDAVGALVDKMREQAQQAELNRKADAAWKQTIEGLTEAIRKRREEQEKALKTDIQMEQESLSGAQAELSGQQGNRRKLNNQLRIAERDLQAARQSSGGVASLGGVAGGADNIAKLEQRVRDLRGKIADIMGEIGDGEIAIRQAQLRISERAVEGRLDKAAAATNAYTAALGKLRVELQAGTISQAQFEKRLEAAAKRRDREVATANAAKSSPGLAKVTPTEVGSLLKDQFGGTVTSTTGGKHVKNSYHYAAQAVDFVPSGGMGSISKAQIQAAADAAGIKVLELLGPGDKGHKDHFHLAFAKQRLGPDQVAKAQASRARVGERAVDRTKDQDDAFAGRMAQLDEQLLIAQLDLVRGTAAEAEVAKARVDHDQKQYELAIAAAVNDKQLRESQAELLVGKSREVSAQRKKNIDARAAEQLVREQNEITALKTQIEVDGLRHEEKYAVTLREKADLQKKIVDALAQIELLAQQEIIDSATASDQQKELARLRQQQIKNARLQAHEDIKRENAGAGERYLDEIRSNGRRIDEEMDKIKVRGLDALNEGLTDAIMGTEKLGDVFKNVADQIIRDLLRIAIQQAVIKPMAEALFGSGGGGGFGGGGGSSGGFLGGLLGTITRAGMSLFGGGGGLGTASGSSTIDGASILSSFYPGRAVGGPVWPGMPYLVGEKGPEVIVPRSPGVVIPNGKGMGGGAPQEIIVRVVGSEMLEAHVMQSAGRAAAAVAPAIVNAAHRTTVKSLSRPRM